MDSTDIVSLSSRKRKATDGEKMRGKKSRVTSNLIKTREEQNTAYLDLMEKHQSLQAEHERLRQNMSSVTMQNEDITAAMQEEQRLRSETLNRLSDTRSSLRELSDELDDQMGRLSASVQCSAVARVELAALFGSALQNVEMREQALKEKLKLSEDHSARIVACTSDAQRQAEAAIGAARDQAQAANALATEMRTRRDELNKTVARLKVKVEKKDNIIAEQRQELDRFMADAKTEFARGRQMIADLRKDDSTATAETRAMEAAGEAARASEALSASEARFNEETTQLNTNIKNLESYIADLKQEITYFKRKNEALGAQIKKKDEKSAAAAAAAKSEVSSRADVITQLMRAAAEEAEDRARCDEMLRTVRAELQGAASALDLAQEQVRVLELKLRLSVAEVVKLRSAAEERDKLLNDANYSSLQNDEAVTRARQERDEAIERKKAAEVALAKTKVELMQVNSQLFEAVRQKVDLGQQLEQCQMDQELTSEKRRKLPAPPPPPPTRASKLLGFFHKY